MRVTGLVSVNGRGIAFAGLFACMACGSADSPPEEGADPPVFASGGAAGMPQPVSPSCAAFPSCYEQCLCMYNDSSGCVTSCSAAPPMPGGTGGGGTLPPPSQPPPPGAGGSAPVPPPPPPPTSTTTPPPVMPPPGIQLKTAQIDTLPVVVQPGQEVFKCQNFANPFPERTDVAVLKHESFMTPGSHHMFVFYNDGNQNSGTQDCSGLEYGTTIHSAARPQVGIDYPQGVGRMVRANQGFRTLVHILNTSAQAIEFKISVVFHYTDTSAIEQFAGSVFLNQPFISIPGNARGAKAGGVCTLPKDVHLLTGVSHMHQYGTHFIARASTGPVLYETTEWSEPEITQYEPDIFMPSGSRITYECTYDNPTPNTITFGDSAQTNEMCIFAGSYYSQQGQGESIACILGL